MGQLANVGNTLVPYVLIDTDADANADYEIDLVNIDATDVLYAVTYDLHAPPTADPVDYEPANFFEGDTDTNVFDTNVVMLPVLSSAIGVLTDGTTGEPISYTLATYDGSTGGNFDEASVASFDAGNPPIKVSDLVYSDLPGFQLTYTATAATDALVFHLHNGDADRAVVLNLPAASAAGAARQRT